MKKIALLSFHNAANYGAALQAFALQEALTRKGMFVNILITGIRIEVTLTI